MTESETTYLFGIPDTGVIYVSGQVMKNAGLKPGNKIRLTAEKDGFRVQFDGPSQEGQQ